MNNVLHIHKMINPTSKKVIKIKNLNISKSHFKNMQTILSDTKKYLFQKRRELSNG
ncbi:hypothetical protein Q6A90_04910 [Aliarcobacter skirrowii]|uniref:hypothetical protein n=1 Tax=Aliarcobacter skirrowii TaxID=28200 RepID=UPI0029B5C5B1|nr:hypothetical protein [Aliarcobacter skirrowii]MDX4061702.1 hypothetical protein [Aliarcobacter skirrowii]